MWRCNGNVVLAAHRVVEHGLEIGRHNDADFVTADSLKVTLHVLVLSVQNRRRYVGQHTDHQVAI